MAPLKATVAELIGRSRLLSVRPGDRVETLCFFKAVLGPKEHRSVRSRLVPAGTTLQVIRPVFRREGSRVDELAVFFPYDDPEEDGFCVLVDNVRRID